MSVPISTDTANEQFIYQTCCMFFPCPITGLHIFDDDSDLYSKMTKTVTTRGVDLTYTSSSAIFIVDVLSMYYKLYRIGEIGRAHV